MKRVAALTLAVLAFALACTSGAETARKERQSRATTQSPTPNLAAEPERCSRGPVPHKRQDVRAVAFARGDPPVYVGLGTAAVVRYTQDTRVYDGWYYYKTLWAIAPEYGGEVTVTGHQIDGANEVLFNAGSGFPGTKLTKLEVPGSGDGEWRYAPSDTLIRADGCYAFRIEGEGFVHWVTFIARA